MLSAKEVLEVSPIIPVLAIQESDTAVEIALALQAGGINIMEITLRTDAAVEAIKKVAKEVPSMIVGAGTVLNVEQFSAVEEVGAKFVISPGMTPSLLKHAHQREMAFIPGVSSAGDIMSGLEYGLKEFKLFPANVVGSIGALKAYSAPFKGVSFCPTGGVNLENVQEYLSLENVVCVGGTWIVPKEVIKNKDYADITRLCREAITLVGGNNGA